LFHNKPELAFLGTNPKPEVTFTIAALSLTFKVGSRIEINFSGATKFVFISCSILVSRCCSSAK
jgi:hypothetical protein